MDGIESLLGSLHFDLFLAAAETVTARTMNLSFLKILILSSLKNYNFSRFLYELAFACKDFNITGVSRNS